MPGKVGATNKRMIGVKIEDGELRDMVEASHVDAAGTAVLALARLGLRLMRTIDPSKVAEVRS